MVAVTSRVSDEVEGALNRWAAEEGVQRSDLIRQILAEAVEARREGRANFARPELPGPADLQRLAGRFDQLATELDRVLRHNAKREGELLRQAKEQDAEGTMLRERLVREVAARLTEAAAPLREQVNGMQATLREAVDRQPRLDTIDAKLATVVEALGQPRTQTTYQLGAGSGLAGRWLAPIVGAVMLFGIGCFFGLAALLPARWVALPSANHLLGGGDQAICALVNYRFGTDSCTSRTNGREVGVTVTQPAPNTERPR